MKKLTKDQLGELGIHNTWEFCRDFWLVDYTAHSRQTMGSFGWWLHTPSKRNPEPPRFRNENAWRIGGYERGSARPWELEQLAGTLASAGLAMPSRWIKFMGAWMDADLYEKRMAELVGRYKERVKP